LFTLFLSGISGLIIANTIINVGDVESYAHYSILIGITALLPFLDFGIGYKVNSIILNHYAISNPQVRRDLSRCATILTCISCILILISLLLYHIGVFGNLTSIGFQTDDALLIEIILVLTFINVPLSLGSRILFAEGNVLKPQLVGLGGTLFTLLFLPIVVILPENQFKWLSVIPILSMVIVNAILTHQVQTKSVFRMAFDIKLIDREIKPIFQYGLKATIVTSFFPIVLQVPKYALGSENMNHEIAKYSLWLLFIQPIISVSTFSTYGALPNIRKTYEQTKQKKRIIQTYLYSSLVAFVLAVFLTTLVLINPFEKLTLPSVAFSSYLILLLPIYVFRQNVTATFTNVGNLSLLKITYAISLIIAMGIYMSLNNFTATNSILVFLLSESLICLLLTLSMFKRHLNFIWTVKLN